MEELKLLKMLPPQVDIETKKILKKTSSANKKLGELKGLISTIPNSLIIINTLSLREAKDSSEIENIVTTNDELFKADIDIAVENNSTKEVKNYNLALKEGHKLVKDRGILTTNMIVEIQGILEKNKIGIRTQMGTVLKNSKGETIYTPPQNHSEILDLMSNLENYINTDEDDIDFLIKLAVIHYQFESIHPFYDGNGRTGRILNILYLILKDLLDIPVLYLSSYIIKNKSEYYKLLQDVRDKNDWESWILYILEGIEETAIDTIKMIKGISNKMKEVKNKILDDAPKIYSKDLLEVIFKHPYTKLEFLINELNVSRQTASKYLNTLTEIGVLDKIKIQNTNYYINIKLLEILSS